MNTSSRSLKISDICQLCVHMCIVLLQVRVIRSCNQLVYVTRMKWTVTVSDIAVAFRIVGLQGVP